VKLFFMASDGSCKKQQFTAAILLDLDCETRMIEEKAILGTRNSTSRHALKTALQSEFSSTFATEKIEKMYEKFKTSRMRPRIQPIGSLNRKAPVAYVS
jgi:hypothetical protein